VKEFVLDLDRKRKLIFDFDAWDLITDHFVSAYGKDFDLASFNITYRDLPFLVFAALKWEDPSLTLEQVKQMLNEAIRSEKINIMQIFEVVTGAIYAQSGLNQQPELKTEIISPQDISKNLPAAEDPQKTGLDIKES